MGDPDFPTLFGKAGRPGAYLRIVREGEIGAGDPVRVVHRPAHGVTVGDVAHIYHSARHEAHRLLNIPELADVLKRWAARRPK
jgi:MOSC domain-containing protein YiiM